MSAVKTIAQHTGFAEKDIVLWGGFGILAFILYKGGLGKAIESLTSAAGSAAIHAASGAVTGVVTGVSEGVGIPTPADTTDDPYVARYIIDDPRGGQLAASKWASVSAFVKAQSLPAGSGYPPPAGGKIAAAFPPFIDMGSSGEW